MRLFADDSIIYRKINSDEDQRVLSEDLKKLQNWAEKWQMIFKPEKCFLMNITNRRNPSLYTYSMSDTPLSVIKSLKYLGIFIYNNLIFNEQKAHSALAILQRTLYAAPQNCKKKSPVSR